MFGGQHGAVLAMKFLELYRRAKRDAVAESNIKSAWLFPFNPPLVLQHFSLPDQTEGTHSSITSLLRYARLHRPIRLSATLEETVK